MIALAFGLVLAATGPTEWRVPGGMLAMWEGAWLIAAFLRGVSK